MFSLLVIHLRFNQTGSSSQQLLVLYIRTCQRQACAVQHWEICRSLHLCSCMFCVFPTGPCPPCPKMVRSPCYCGQSTPQTRRCSAKDWSCGQICQRPLTCGQHMCQTPCHAGWYTLRFSEKVKHVDICLWYMLLFKQVNYFIWILTFEIFCMVIIKPLSTTGLLTPSLIGSYSEMFTWLANYDTIIYSWINAVGAMHFFERRHLFEVICQMFNYL